MKPPGGGEAGDVRVREPLTEADGSRQAGGSRAPDGRPLLSVEGNLCIEEASKSRIGWRGDLVVVSPAEGGGVVPLDDPPLDLSLFIGARIAISGDTEEFEEVRTAVHL